MYKADLIVSVTLEVGI